MVSIMVIFMQSYHDNSRTATVSWDEYYFGIVESGIRCIVLKTPKIDPRWADSCSWC
jgi:hypothetical protein